MSASRMRWLRDRRRVASALVVALVVGTIVALSVNYRGLATADVDLNDGGVWVSNEQSVLIGRLNYQVREIDATLAADTPDIDLLQRGNDVIMYDRSAGLLRHVDTANVQFAGSGVTVPARSQVALSSAGVSVLDPADGRLWVVPLAGLAGLADTTSEPTASIGEGAQMAMADDGTVHVLDTVGHRLLSYPPDVWTALSDPAAQSGSDAELGPEIIELADGIDLTTADVQIAAVGQSPVVLAYQDDPGTLTLIRPGEENLDLSEVGIDIASSRLQATSADGDRVVLATTDALVTVPLAGDEPRVLPSPAAGPPATPVQVGGCAHSAWSGTTPSYVTVCGDGDPAEQAVPSAAIGAQLVFRVNRQNVVLNDLRSGDVWMLENTLVLVQNWEDAVSTTSDDTETDEPSDDETDEVPLDREAENQAPVANPDDLGGRPGRTIVLPVLDNDRDPDGDLLTIDAVAAVPETFGRIEPILGGRALQIRMTPQAEGEVVADYTISDGRGGEDSTTVTITAYASMANQMPEQLREITPEVVSGESVEVNILNDVRDREGDEIYLLGASGDDTVNVSVRPDGLVRIQDLGVATGLKQIIVRVSDGRSEPSEITIDLQVLPAAAAPPQAVFDFATGFVGDAILVRPLANDLDPNGRPLNLAIVNPPEGGTQVTDNTSNTFTFTAAAAGSYYLTYVVTDDDGLSADGLVRVDVVEPAPEAAPVAVRDTGLLPPGGSVAVDVLDNDYDPAGGVLAVQSIDIPAGSGLQVAILDHRVLRITSDRSISQTMTVGYTVSNGQRSSAGEVVVVPLAADAAVLRPVANPDVATVRVSDHVTIPVLRNDSHPNGIAFHLSGIEVADDTPGLAFSSQDLVRFAAPDEPGSYEVTYHVTDLNGQTDSAVLTIYVEARTDEANSPPRPADIEVRAFAGERIRIPVDIYGIDPDGDSVQLVGPTTSPARGRIVEIGAGYLDYVAFNDLEGGTDRFEISVRDRLGAIGTAEVTVGVIPPPTTNRNPVAAADRIEVKPNREIEVDVVLNDTDPDGDQLQFAPDPIVDSPAGLEATIAEGLLAFTSPQEEGDYTLQYRIDDGHGGQDIGALTVTVDKEASPLPPVAVDDVVPPNALIDAQTIDVQVLENDYDPDGSDGDLVVSLASGQEDIDVLRDGRLRIPVTATRQVVTYRIEDLDGEETYAFVEVPGTDDTGPVLLPEVDLEVNSGEELVIDLNEYVVSLTGDPVQLYDPESVTATNSDGGPYVVDPGTLRYVSAPEYAGQASITFSVTDAPDVNADGILMSVLTLPITVIPTTAQAPTFRNASMDMEAGGDEVTLEIGRFAADRDTENADLELTIGPAPAGFSVDLDGLTLTASAPLSTVPGTSGDLTVFVDDGTNPPVEGTVTLRATSTLAPMLVANDDDLGEVFQGVPASADVLANDTNPFPGQPRTISSVGVETGSGSVTVSGDQVIVTPAADFVGRITVVYTVQDATGDPERQVQARVTATVLGVPDAPPRPAIESVGDSEVVLDLTAPSDNGSPITGYRVTVSDGRTVDCASTTCRVTGLTNGVDYTFTVVAINVVGESQPSAPSASVRPDVAPGPVVPPTIGYGDSELSLTWTVPENNGSQITNYDVQISPPTAGGGQVRLPGTATSHTWTGLTNGTVYRVRVRALNDSPNPGDWGSWSRPEYPSAAPDAPATPSVQRSDTPLGGQVLASWAAPADNGDSIDLYHVTLYKNGVAQTTVSQSASGGGGTRVFTVENGFDYSVSVAAENRSGLSGSSPISGAVRSFGAPRQVPAVTAVATGTSGVAALDFAAPPDNGQPIQRYEYALTSSGGRIEGIVPGSRQLSGLSNGTSYQVEIRACNTYCGLWSPSSPSFSTYGQPAQPAVAASVSGQTVTFTWTSPAASNGSTVTNSRYQIGGGGWVPVASRDGSVSITGNWNESHTIDVQVQNQQGQWSATGSATGTIGPDPTPVTLSASRGAQVVCLIGGGTCFNVVLNYSNLPPVAGGYDLSFVATSAACGTFTAPTAGSQALYTGVDISGTSSWEGTNHWGLGCVGGTVTWTARGGGETYTGSSTW
ncbi:MAG: Ig-like domain-containing protein [Beutenbergiaceae bacterium]